VKVYKLSPAGKGMFEKLAIFLCQKKHKNCGIIDGKQKM
jgi:hypothetical protein